VVRADLEAMTGASIAAYAAYADGLADRIRATGGSASAIGGALAGLASCLLTLQYDVHPFIGNTFGPLLFMICVLGGLGDMIGGFVAAFVMSQIIAIGGYYFSTELSYVFAFTFFIVLMFVRPRGVFSR